MRFQRYLDQIRDWPQAGRHILAQFDADSIYVYQAYRPSLDSRSSISSSAAISVSAA